MEGQRGRVYSPARRSGNTLILKLRAEDVTFEEFVATVSNRMLLAPKGPTQGYQTILFGDGDEPIRYGAFVFEGADLKAVEAALTDEWGAEKVCLAEHLVDMVLDFPGRFSEEEIRAAVQQVAEKYKIIAVEMLS